MMQKNLVIVAVFLLITGICYSVAQAAPVTNDQLVKVTVNITIENPEYFWQYPFWGKQLEEIRISAMGNTTTIHSQSSGQQVEYQVPKGYKFRVWLDFSDGNSTYKKLYIAKQDINMATKRLNIILKAPDEQEVIIKSSDFTEKSTQ